MNNTLLHDALWLFIPFAIVFILYDALRHNSKTEARSKAWHSLGWLIFAWVGIMAIKMAFSLTFVEMALAFWVYKLLFQLCIGIWVVKDATWGGINAGDIMYSGNGKGNFLEIFLNYLAKKTGQTLDRVTYIAKLVAITICFTI